MRRINILSGFFVFAALLITVNVNAQYQVQGSEEFINKMKMKYGGNALNKLTYADIKGSPYLFPYFKPATIFTNNNEVVNYPIRYDLYANEMEIKNESGIYSIVQPEFIKLITTDSMKLIFSSYTNSSGKAESVNRSYFILKSEGKCRFLIKKELRLQEPEKPKLYQDAKPAEFLFLKDTYYFKIGDNAATRITNKNDVLTVMADKASQVGVFIKEKRINLNRSEDLQKLAEFYNDLP